MSISMPISLCNLDCHLPTGADAPDAITGLRFTPSAFDSFRRITELTYSLRAASTVSIYIVKKDSSQKEFLVKTLAVNLDDTKGSHSITWIGDSDAHVFAPVGIYFGVVQIQLRRFQTIVQVFHY